MKGYIKNLQALALALCTTQGWAAGQPGQNLWLHGSLVADPCVIQPGDETVELNFGTIVDKYIYLNQRTPGAPFKIILQECDPDIAQSVTVKFSGNASPEGLLIPDSPVSPGILIGIEKLNGEKVEINGAGHSAELQRGGNEIALQAYVQGEQEALKNNGIKHGEFTASSTFELIYN